MNVQVHVGIGDVVTPATGEVTETEIARDLPEVTAHIMWNPDGVTIRGWDPP